MNSVNCSLRKEMQYNRTKQFLTHSIGQLEGYMPPNIPLKIISLKYLTESRSQTQIWSIKLGPE